MTKRKRPEKEVLERLRKQGLSYAAIADQFNTTAPTVAHWFSDLGISRRRSNARCPDCSDLVRLYKSGKTQVDLATLFGVHLTTVQHWFLRCGIKGRDPSEWKLKYASHFDITPAARSFLTGSLLGDGHLERTTHTARLVIGTNRESYAGWYKAQLASFGIEGAPIRHTINVRKGKEHPRFEFKSHSYVELGDLAKRFYTDGGKIVPRDIEITPLMLLVWYLDDGELWHQKSSSDQIQLCTDAFPPEDVQFLVGKLSGLGFSARYYKSRNRIRINAISVPDFLEYIGPCPDMLYSDFHHKWEMRLTSKLKAMRRNGTHRQALFYTKNERKEVNTNDLSWQ